MAPKRKQLPKQKKTHSITPGGSKTGSRPSTAISNRITGGIGGAFLPSPQPGIPGGILLPRPGQLHAPEVFAALAAKQMEAVADLQQMSPAKRQQILIESGENVLKNHMVNADGFDSDHALSLAILASKFFSDYYANPCTIDVAGVQEMVDTVVKKLLPDKKEYKHFLRLFGLDGSSNEIVHMETYQERYGPIMNYWISKLRTFKNMMMFSPDIQDAIYLISDKVRTSKENVSAHDKAMGAFMIYYLLLMYVWYFPSDVSPTSKNVNLGTLKRNNARQFSPEDIIPVAKNFFAKMPDGDILYDPIIAFIDSFPEEIRKNVYDFAQITTGDDAEQVTTSDDTDSNTEQVPTGDDTDSNAEQVTTGDDADTDDDWQPIIDAAAIKACQPITYGDIRKKLKGVLFPNFCSMQFQNVVTLSGLSKEEICSFRTAYMASRKQPFDKLPITQNLKLANALEDPNPQTGMLSYVIVNKRTIGMGISNGNPYTMYACSPEEYGMYAILYTYLQANPEIRFCTEDKTFAEYGMNEWSFDLLSTIEKWILDFEFSAAADNINWELTEFAINYNDPKTIELFRGYHTGTVSKEEVLSGIGFDYVANRQDAKNYFTLRLAEMVFSKYGVRHLVEGDLLTLRPGNHPNMSEFHFSLYQAVIKWILNNLNTNIGIKGEHKTPIDYDLQDLAFEPQYALTQVLLDMGIVSSQEDINLDLLRKFLYYRYHGNCEGALLNYFTGDGVSAEETLSRLMNITPGNKKQMLALAKMYFSRSGILAFGQEHIALAQQVQYANEHAEYVAYLCRDIYGWIIDNADSTEICPDGKSLKEHFHTDELRPVYELAIASIILKHNLALDEKDINWELTRTIMTKAYGANSHHLVGIKPYTAVTMLHKYLNFEITEEYVLALLGFAPADMNADSNLHTLAKMCFSHSGLELFNPEALKRVLRNCRFIRSVTDELYIELYHYLKANNPICGGKRFSAYGLNNYKV